MKKFTKINEDRDSNTDIRTVLQKAFNAMDGVKAIVNETSSGEDKLLKVNIKFTGQLEASKVVTIFGNLSNTIIIDIKYLEKAKKMHIISKMINDK